MKAVFIIPQIGANERELFTMKSILEKNKVSCTIASFSKGKVIGKYGRSFNASGQISSLRIDSFDCCIVVGGENASSLADYSQVTNLLTEADRQNKLIALLCMHPAIFLDKLPFLMGKNLTAFKSANSWPETAIEAAGAKYLDEPVVQDKNLITCQNEKDAGLCAEQIVHSLFHGIRMHSSESKR